MKSIDQTIKDNGEQTFFACFKDMTVWYVCGTSRDVLCNEGELGVDAPMSHVSRSFATNVRKAGCC